MMEYKKKKNSGEWHLRIAVAFLAGILVGATFCFLLLYKPTPTYSTPLNATRTNLYYPNPTVLKQLETIDAQATISWQATQTAIATP